MIQKKVILILVDGLRPDGIDRCGSDFANKFKAVSCNTMSARTVLPSITLPCHMSLFHSVPPQRHGILTNIYVPQVRPVKGLFDVLHDAGKHCASIYNWEELRDVGRPGSLDYSFFYSEQEFEDADEVVTQNAIWYTKRCAPDFLFLYLGLTDETGHKYGWMSREYLQVLGRAWGCIEKIYEEFAEGYTIFVTADHGGHERTHGDNCKEDMTIPLFICDPAFMGQQIECAEIIDIAPTITALLGVSASKDWEGKNLI